MANRETVIVDRSFNPLAIIAGILFVIAILFVGYLVFFNGSGESGTVDVDLPAVSVDVVPDGR